MLPQHGSGRQRRPSSSSGTLYWVVLVALALTAGASLFLLQNAVKEIASLKESIEKTDVQRRNLGEQVNQHKQRLAQAQMKADSVSKERDELLMSQKEAKKAAQNTTSVVSSLSARVNAAEKKLAASEKEIREITVKAGSCQQQFASLNAECATLKQGLANLGLTSRTVEKTSDNSISAGALDPRGGIEAAKVLKDHSEQPWKTSEVDATKKSSGASSRVQVGQPKLLHNGQSNLEGTDLDETGPGLEKALAQGGASAVL